MRLREFVNILCRLSIQTPQCSFLATPPRYVSTTLSQVLPSGVLRRLLRLSLSIRSHGPPDLTTWASWEHRKPEGGPLTVVKVRKVRDKGQPPQHLQDPIQSSQTHDTCYSSHEEREQVMRGRVAGDCRLLRSLRPLSSCAGITVIVVTSHRCTSSHAQLCIQRLSC